MRSRDLPLVPALLIASFHLSVCAASLSFHCTKHHEEVRLSNDCLTASLLSNGTGGVVISSSPVPLSPHVGLYFQLTVDEVGDHLGSGLAIGLTTTDPATLSSVPHFAIDVADSWFAGYTGTARLDSTWDDSFKFYSNRLEAGDTVALLLSVQRYFMVFHNGRLKDWRFVRNVVRTLELPMFALVDVRGDTRVVTLARDAHPPDEVIRAARKVAREHDEL
ncbi:unnamed protein product [Vitrella brassicaformis CCMP3155]|uniref:NHR domain-containing protein n=2 Tax=Vitrella brassicaformis TaxID=1169539 RepID=A0A0G4EEK4_VITBC|nr:unnamed protein product [Vitrella brassicaformis CCMP3155]|eukprot:CEL93826.1 unnamed protein product [Vitrella brassicaformis CCMP3155]